MTDERLDEALQRVKEILAIPYGRCCQTEAEMTWLEGWAATIQTLNTVAADGKCGYCGQPIEAFPDGTDYCACTTKRPCRHRYFTRPSGKKCAACNVIDPFITAMLR